MQSFSRALVTGASTGIGAAIAEELATLGTDLVVVARSKDRLDELADRLRTDHGVGVEVLSADLLDPDERALVEDRLRSDDAPVDLLVNNAGVGQSGPFLDSDADRAEQQIALNAVVLTRLTSVVLPRLVAAGAGGVLNISSVGGFQPVPHLAVYAATKAYVTSFTEALHEELRGTGVHVTASCPGFTRTDFVAAADGESEAANIPGFLWQEAGPVARSAVDAVRRGRVLAVSGAINQAVSFLSTLTPSTVSRRLIGEVIARLP